MSGKFSVISFDGRIYRVRPTPGLVREIEEELGGIPALAEGFAGTGWTAGALVALVQMMLQAAGRTVDYDALLMHMLEAGLGVFALRAAGFLNLILDGETT